MSNFRRIAVAGEPQGTFFYDTVTLGIRWTF